SAAQFFVSRFSDGPGLCQQGWRDRRRRGASPRYASVMGQGRGENLDSQDRRADRKRFYSCSQDRKTSSKVETEKYRIHARCWRKVPRLLFAGDREPGKGEGISDDHPSGPQG